MILKMGFREYLAVPFGFVLSWIFDFTESYLLSLFILTVIVKIILFPSAITQQKSTAKQVRLQPKVRRIQNTYAGNQQKIQAETTALYQREGYNQMSSGCLPLLIQLPIMIGLWEVMYTPLSTILKIPENVLTALKEAVIKIDPSIKEGNRQIQINILEHIGKLANTKGLTGEMYESIQNFADKFQVFGINLAETPKFGDFSNLLWLIPVLAGLTSLASALYTMIKQKRNNPGMQSGASMGCMALSTPLMSLAFTFMFPAGVGVYWIMSNIISFVQTVVLYNIYNPKKLIAKQMVEETIRRRSYEENLKYISKKQNED